MAPNRAFETLFSLDLDLILIANLGRRRSRGRPHYLGQFQTGGLALRLLQVSQNYRKLLSNWMLGGLRRQNKAAYFSTYIDPCCGLRGTVSNTISSNYYQPNDIILT